MLRDISPYRVKVMLHFCGDEFRRQLACHAEEKCITLQEKRSARATSPQEANHEELNRAQQQKPQAKDNRIQLINIHQVQTFLQLFCQLNAKRGRGQQQSREKAQQQNATRDNQRFERVIHGHFSKSVSAGISA